MTMFEVSDARTGYVLGFDIYTWDIKLVVILLPKFWILTVTKN